MSAGYARIKCRVLEVMGEEGEAVMEYIDSLKLKNDEPYAKREYKLAYIENGKRHHCGEAETIQEAESLRSNRAKIFAPLEVVILEKETVCREIRYT